MKNLLELALSRRPAFYARILKHKPNCNSEKRLFLGLVRDKDTVLDVGANRGRYTILFSHIVGRSGRVYAFEPVPPTFTHLSEHVVLNGRFGNVYLNNVAVGDKVGEIVLYMPNDDSEQASLTEHDAGSWSGNPQITTFSCEITTLDCFTTQKSLFNLDFIKIDVEGAELFVLQGATNIISKFKPLIYLEVNPLWIRNFGYSPANLFSLLISLGYTDFFVASEKLEPLLDPISEYAAGRFSESINIICAMDSIHKQKIKSLVSRF